MYVCTICGYIFDESKGTLWSELPEDWVCPLCGADKSAFEVKEETGASHSIDSIVEFNEESRGVERHEIAALCSNLAKGCEKQYFPEEAEAFAKIEAYYNNKRQQVKTSIISEMTSQLEDDITNKIAEANTIIDALGDRGSKRALVWGEKVSRMTKSILDRFDTEGESFIEKKKVYVCEICGFIYVGNELPDICPVCKVPNYKMTEIGRD